MSIRHYGALAQFQRHTRVQQTPPDNTNPQHPSGDPSHSAPDDAQNHSHAVYTTTLDLVYPPATAATPNSPLGTSSAEELHQLMRLSQRNLGQR